MNGNDLAKQLDTYSNAIVAFFVVQGLGFCYTFGTSDRFSGIVRTHKPLAIGLAVIFLVTTILALYANRYLHRKMAQLWEGHGDIAMSVCFGKALIIGLFGGLPLLVTVGFGVMA